jgi:hypothetical protein
VLYHLSQDSIPFWSGYFEVRILLFCQGLPGPQPSYFTLPATTGITGVHHYIHLFSVQIGSCKLLLRLAWDRDLSDLSLSSSKDSRLEHWNMPSLMFKILVYCNFTFTLLSPSISLTILDSHLSDMQHFSFYVLLFSLA